MFLKKSIKKFVYPLIKKRPSFIILGAQKAGTTSLFNYLSFHPQLIASKVKEVHYFDWNFEKGFSWYLTQFPFMWKSRGKFTYESSPAYFDEEKVPQRIYDALGKIKLIVMLRDPVERTFSAWKMYHSFKDIKNSNLQKKYDQRDFDDAIQEELAVDDFSKAKPFLYIKRGLYINHLQNYERYFGRDNMLILDYRRLQSDPVNLMNEICDFLGIDRIPEKKIQKIIQKKYNKSEHINYGEYKETLKKLKRFYRSYNIKLWTYIGKDLGWDDE